MFKSDSPNFRLYFQMKPDEASLKHLIDLQSNLPVQDRGRPAPVNGIHLTLIHFGKVHDVFATLSEHVSVDYGSYESLLQKYISDSTELLPRVPITLEPLRFARFGQNAGTLVIEYAPTPELSASHDALFAMLRTFFIDCGIKNVDAYIAKDINFMHALQLRPHITLYKGYAGELPDAELLPVTVSSMPTVYPPVAER